MIRAFCYANNDADLPVSLFESISASQEQAEDLAFEVNAKRRVSKMIGQMNEG
jgi:hypothetical protein